MWYIINLITIGYCIYGIYTKCNQVKELIYTKHPEQLKKRDKYQQEYDEINTENPKVMELPKSKEILLNEQKIEKYYEIIKIMVYLLIIYLFL